MFSTQGYARFSEYGRTGFLESDFLNALPFLTSPNDFEIMADGATRVLAWHMGWTFGGTGEDWNIVHTVEQPVPGKCMAINSWAFSYGY